MELLQLQELCIFHRTRKDITMQIRKYMAQLAALILLLPVFGGCSRPAQEDAVLNRYSRTSFDLFDTVTVITGFDTSEQAFETKADWLLQLLEEYHQLYDIYHDYDGINNLKTVNDHAGLEPVAVDARIIDMLEYSREMYTLTQGMTNIAMGSVLSIWHTYREAGIEDPEHASLPDRAELEAAAQHMDIDSVVIDRDGGTVYLPDPQMQLDVGSIAKGYATEMAAAAAREMGWDHLAFSVGGNVRTIGTKGDGTPWTAGIQNPDLEAQDATFCRVALTDLSLVTSGSYQRYYMVDGVRYHHIIHPQTLQPENSFVSVSILCSHAGMADALSTAVFNMPYDQGRALIESLDGVEAAWIDESGEACYTEGFAQLLIEDER